MLGILFPSLSEGRNCKNSLGYPEANVHKFLMGLGFKCNLLYLWNFYNRYWNQVHAKHENKHVQYIGIKTETRQEINAVNRNRGIYISVYSTAY